MGTRANRKAGGAATALALALALASCVQPVHKVSMDESFVKPDPMRKAWRRIAVLPFAGDPVFRRTAPEWLAFRVEKHRLFGIVGPSLAEIELGKKGIALDGADTSAEGARRAGQLLGVDGVVFGSVDPPGGGGRAQPGVRAGVVDVATGKAVARSARSSAAATRYNAQRVMTAIDLLAEDLVPVLHAAAGRAWTPPPVQETGGSAPDGREAAGTGR